MVAIRTWDGDGLTDGTPVDVNTAGPGDYEFDQVAGTWAVQADASGVRVRCDATGVLTWGGLTGTAGTSAYRVLYTVAALPAAERNLANLLASGGARAAKILIRPTGEFLVRDSNNTNAGISTATLQAGVEYRVELAIQADQDTAQLHVHRVSDNTLVETVSAAGVFVDPVNFKAEGEPGDLVAHLQVNDNDTLPGPYQADSPPPDPTVAWIGDSLAYRDGPEPFQSREPTTRTRIETAGWDTRSIWWYAAGGKPINGADANNLTTVDNLTAADAELQGVGQAIIALGTNDVAQPEQTIIDDVTAALDAAAALGVGEVIWRGVAYASVNNPNAAYINPILRDTVEGHPSNSRYVDWAAYVHDGRDETGLWLPDDGSHMTADGYALWDQFGIESLQGADTEPVPYLIEANGQAILLTMVESVGGVVSPVTLTEG